MAADGVRGRYAKGVERKREILAVAYETLRETGAGGASLRAIGESIGVSHGMLTHYFGSREGLLVEVIREHDRVNDERMPDSVSLVQRMRSSAEFNVQFPGMVSLFTEMLAKSVEAGDGPARSFFTARFARARVKLAAELGGQLAALPEERRADAAMLVDLIMAASDGLQVRWLLDPSVDVAGTLGLLERLGRTS
ncbi:TetR/AcrR family transcriptional regulator [Pseudoclavibacter sp. RFBA6]|uniref:TetR/AcrR family transcriptional regulator n=1 Tax=Pseudoclavibacter sp. RFBA6 TaxID=2080573 RepID=UPI0015E1DD5F|nr:TetR/AcrR family transcriptional regulator [Pseudoclavibacter sp. RFBA6]